LYKSLEKYIDDPIERWKHCVRAKRGLGDTSQAGGM
jgi:hypothetical protein